jgi:hypothetical protein
MTRVSQWWSCSGGGAIAWLAFDRIDAVGNKLASWKIGARSDTRGGRIHDSPGVSCCKPGKSLLLITHVITQAL